MGEFGTPFAKSSLTLNGSLEIFHDRLTDSDHRSSTTTLIPQGEFCLTQNSRIPQPGYRREEPEPDHEGVQAVSCDPCSSQVLCYYLFSLFIGISTSRHGITVDPQRQRGSFVAESIMAIADSNGDSLVDFEEFREKMSDYIRIAYRVLDKNDDNSISEEVKAGNILTRYSLEFFEKALVHVMKFFDTNKDNAIAEEDAFVRYMARYSDRNEDGRLSLFEVLGRRVISLPAPLYNLYSKLDRNKDERLSQEEAIDFIKRTFALIDSNSDCFVDADEVVALFKKLNMSWDRTLAIKLTLQKYLSLANALMEQFVGRADKDDNGRVTVEEVIGFEDFDFKNEIVSIAPYLGAPREVFYLIGERARGDEGNLEVWLTALQQLLDHTEYTDPIPSTSCSGYKGLGLPTTPFLKSINA